MMIASKAGGEREMRRRASLAAERGRYSLHFSNRRYAPAWLIFQHNFAIFIIF
jgi:hypothetical protein